MDDYSVVDEWIRRAKGNLARARAGRIDDDFLYEDLCFDAQQAAEKALKALLIHRGRADFPKTHSISELLTLLEDDGEHIPPRVRAAGALTAFAVASRYPGDWEPVTALEYREALEHAEGVYAWVVKRLSESEGS